MSATPIDAAGPDERRPRAVVFAHGHIGLRCLKVLLAGGVEVVLVVAQADTGDDGHHVAAHDAEAEAGTLAAGPADGALRALCAERRIAVIAPPAAAGAGVDAQRWLEPVRAAGPDLLFRFGDGAPPPPSLLAETPAYNMHASLLPAFPGPAPVRRAVREGAGVTGATLHELRAAPGAAAIVSQMEVPILPDDTAAEVDAKVTVAAEQALWRVLPALLDGKAPRLVGDVMLGGYAERSAREAPGDGRIDWRQPARQVYDLQRSLALPGRGAHTALGGVRYVLERARLDGDFGNVIALGLPPGLAVVDNCIVGVCGDGRLLTISRLTADGVAVTAAQLQARLHG